MRKIYWTFVGDPKVVNGEKEASGDEAEPEEVIDENSEVFYDKAKSFFDNISCEATERAKGWGTLHTVAAWV